MGRRHASGISRRRPYFPAFALRTRPSDTRRGDVFTRHFARRSLQAAATAHHPTPDGNKRAGAVLASALFGISADTHTRRLSTASASPGRRRDKTPPIYGGASLVYFTQSTNTRKGRPGLVRGADPSPSVRAIV